MAMGSMMQIVLVGFPLYTYASVVFAFLVSAGIGSYATHVFNLHERPVIRYFPFVLIPLYGLMLLLLNEPLLNYFLQWSILCLPVCPDVAGESFVGHDGDIPVSMGAILSCQGITAI